MTAVLEAVKLYSILEAAERLGVKKDYVYARVNSGELATVELGDGSRSKKRIRADVLQDWIDHRSG